MSSRRAPDWLEELQARFGSVIRTPLDRSGGKLAAVTDAYDPNLLAEARDGPKTSGAERLAVYNRQYWFRLFTVLQTGFPLTTRLMGHWGFNDYAARFLLAHPPRSWDIDDVTRGFDAFFAEELARENAAEREALVEAVRIDAAHHAVFRAPEVTPYRPSAADAAHLLEARLLPSPEVELVEQHWPLLELRKKLRGDASEARVPLPPPLPEAAHFALIRRREGIGELALEPREAELFELLRRHPVGEALARLESACSERERSDLPARAHRWLARSVELDFWIGSDVSRK